MIEAINAINSALADLQSLAGATSAPPTDQLIPDASSTDGTAPTSFAQALQTALGQVDSAVANANTTAQSFSSGDQSIPLSDVMVSLEQANLAVQMASGVRDKVVAAYTNIMNMQV
jgi:flagellar hook-basal body complex protein FliE